jgi:HK97 family phage portal protein
MRNAIATTFESIGRFIRGKTHIPASLSGPQWSGTQFVDAYKRNRVPTSNEMLAELKNTAFTCASINAAVCATYSPRLFVWTGETETEPRVPVKRLDIRKQNQLRKAAHRGRLPNRIKHSARIDEIVDHPILDLFEKCNPAHNGFDLWELTTFYQETVGSAYWYIETDNLGVPSVIWILPAQNVTPKRRPGSKALVDYYEYKIGNQVHEYPPAAIIHFRYPDPKDPYNAGLSPLRAAWEQVALTSEYLAFKKATWENAAIPAAVISPDEVIGEEERDRLEAQWNHKFRRGGAGRTLFSESGMKVSVLSHSMGDVAALAEYGATKDDVCNAFHVPVSYLNKETNLANLEAAEQQHLSLAIQPRIWRRDQKINECLIPRYDDSGRLFIASDDPLGVDMQDNPEWFDLNMKHGVTTINEVRRDWGMEPVLWGETPWLPLNLAQTDFPPSDHIPPGSKREDYAMTRGRNRRRFQTIALQNNEKDPEKNKPASIPKSHEPISRS